MSIPNPFAPATRLNRRAKLALVGLPGAGKTLTALLLARALAGPLGRIAVIDTEGGAASIYVGYLGLRFDTLTLDRKSPQAFIDAILAAQQNGYDAIVIDSLSHLHMGEGGALELAQSSPTGWASVSPQVQRVFRHIIEARIHVVSTLRQKDDYVYETNERGRTEPRLVGTSPVSKKGTAYEFDAVLTAGDPLKPPAFTVTKCRIPLVSSGTVYETPTGEEIARPFLDWFDGAADPVPAPTMDELRARKQVLVDAGVIGANDRPGVAGQTEEDRRIIDEWLRGYEDQRPTALEDEESLEQWVTR